MGGDGEEHQGIFVSDDRIEAGVAYRNNMEYSFPHYLLSKQSVDDRALNKDVLNALKAKLPPGRIRIIEVGAGIGTMLKRLIYWDVIHNAEYVMVDGMRENIEYARAWIPQFAGEAGLRVEGSGRGRLRLSDDERDIQIHLAQADVFDFVETKPDPADVLIAHAFLDLLPLPESLPKLFSLTKRLAWLTINFDGVTTFKPTIDATLDETIERLYHETMDARPTGGDSKSGRHLFGYLQHAGAQILAAGASDWVVHPLNGMYPNDEAFFLNFILNFLEGSLAGHPKLADDSYTNWLKKRRAQVERGELVYIAHQMDFLAQV